MDQKQGAPGCLRFALALLPTLLVAIWQFLQMAGIVLSSAGESRVGGANRMFVGLTLDLAPFYFVAVAIGVVVLVATWPKQF